ncbi:MAG: hypothetical protein RQ867_10205 [Mariprofundaceae bacterium]|nr:hypothetical protein [Mariprofundaceae bacterium]
MIAPFVLLLSLLGIMLNLGLAGVVIQPDWSAAILLASILAQRGNWVWALPGIWMHDLMLHWSSLVCLPVVALIPFLLASADARLGPGRPQRVLLMLAGLSPLLWAGWSVSQWLLTLLVCTCAWYFVASPHVKPA